MKYVKKAIPVEAYQTDQELYIDTLEGVMHASVGDYIITGVNGEQYPCKPDIFEKTYDKVEESERVLITNREVLERQPDEDFTRIIFWLVNDYSKRYTNSKEAVEKWLGELVSEKW